MKDPNRVKPLHATITALLTLCASAANAGEHWTRAVQVDAVSITVHVVTYNELARKQSTRNWQAGLAGNRKGYAELYRNRDTGQFTCRIYVTVDHTQETIEHESRHCRGFTHE